jgi:cell division protein ZapA
VLAALNLAYQLAERAQAPAAAPAISSGGGTAGPDEADIDALVRRVDAALGDDGQLL